MQQKIISIKEQIANAIEEKAALQIIGGNSKAFLGRTSTGTALNMADYQGIISYEPTELYITVKAGTLLSEVKAVLAEQGQMLAFEPPEVNEKTTMGGVVATGLSGPRRPYAGSVRDFVLGIRCINGLAKEMSFGGQVMKNVAGYDLSRLLTGSFGTLAVILEITFKVLPLPEFELSASKAMQKHDALQLMSTLSGQSLPISAAAYYDGKIYIRYSGNEKVIRDNLKKNQFEADEKNKTFWKELRKFKSPIFNSAKPIWRLSLPSASNFETADDNYLIDWGGAQYWLASDRPANELFTLAKRQGGSAFLFRGGDRTGDIFQALPDELFKLQKNLKQAFDPHRVLNPNKMYRDL